MVRENRHSQFYIRFNREYGDKLDCKSITDISVYFDIPLTVLENAYQRGHFAFKKKLACTNLKINTAEYHGFARLYRLVLSVVDIRTGRKKKVHIDKDLVKSSLKN